MDWKVAENVGARIADLRKALGGISQRKLAARVGVGSKQVSKWENGDQVPPRTRLASWVEREGWPIEMFAEGGPMPSTVVNKPVNDLSGEGRALYVSTIAGRPRVRVKELVEEVQNRIMQELFEHGLEPVPRDSIIWADTEAAERKTRLLLRRMDDAMDELVGGKMGTNAKIGLFMAKTSFVKAVEDQSRHAGLEPTKWVADLGAEVEENRSSIIDKHIQWLGQGLPAMVKRHVDEVIDEMTPGLAEDDLVDVVMNVATEGEEGPKASVIASGSRHGDTSKQVRQSESTDEEEEAPPQQKESGE